MTNKYNWKHRCLFTQQAGAQRKTSSQRKVASKHVIRRQCITISRSRYDISRCVRSCGCWQRRTTHNYAKQTCYRWDEGNKHLHQNKQSLAAANAQNTDSAPEKKSCMVVSFVMGSSLQRLQTKKYRTLQPLVKTIFALFSKIRKPIGIISQSYGRGTQMQFSVENLENCVLNPNSQT